VYKENVWLHKATFRDILMDFCSDRSCECVYKIWSS